MSSFDIIKRQVNRLDDKNQNENDLDDEQNNVVFKKIINKIEMKYVLIKINKQQQNNLLDVIQFMLVFFILILTILIFYYFILNYLIKFFLKFLRLIGIAD